MLLSTTTEPDFAFYSKLLDLNQLPIDYKSIALPNELSLNPLRKSWLVSPYPFGVQLLTLPSLHFAR